MEIKHLHTPTLVLILCYCSFVSAQNIILKQKNENGIYKSGEKIRVTLFLNDKTTDSVTVKIKQNFSKDIIRKLSYTGDSLDIFS